MPLAPASVTLLEQAQVAYRVHEHPEAHATQQFMALGFPVQQMVKTLAFQAGGGDIVLVALRAIDVVDYGAVARAVGMSRAKLAPLDEELLRERLGMQAGGVGPFVQQEGVRLLVDRKVPALAAVFCGTGERTSTLEVPGQAFAAMADAVLGEFAKSAGVPVQAIGQH